MGQLYYKDLYKYFFVDYPKDTTMFLAVSGYVGPEPIRRLNNLPFESKVVYGLQRETPNQLLHQQLLQMHSEKVAIYYSGIPSHSKCYLWLNGNKPLRGLVGSANFSINGLNNDYRETLIELERPDLHVLRAYMNIIEDSSSVCTNVEVLDDDNSKKDEGRESICEMVLYDPVDGEVQQSSGLNWGFSPNGNVTPNDAYIPIRMKHIKTYPDLFKPIFISNDAGHRERKIYEKVEIIWDDGFSMEALFEGSQPGPGNKVYPKQISSVPKKNILGEYIRKRIGLKLVSNNPQPTERITRKILLEYGCDSIKLKMLEPGIYYADFSTNK